ncbi:hypothetical protein DFH27DRAFT_608367 [Peziza echinospora]|nr:hypothetical protein DFH27DRAFT_608367 [Peziza echinospora]
MGTGTGLDREVPAQARDRTRIVSIPPRGREQELSTKNQQIAQFARDIVRLNDDRPDARRDDSYYQNKLASLFRSIDQWVYIHYGKAEITDTVVSSLEEDLSSGFQSQAGDEWVNLLQRGHISFLQAFCTLHIIRPILSEPLLGVNHPCVAVVKPAIEASIGDSSGSEARIKWRITTANLYQESPIFWEAFREQAQRISSKLVEDLSCFAPTARPAPERGSWWQFLKRLGNSGPFEIGGFTMVKDVRGLVSEQQLASGGDSFAVKLTVSPAVVRVSHLNNKEILVEQARVLLDATVE